MEKVYRVYTIQSASDNMYYVGVTTSKGTNLVKWMFDKYREDNNCFTELGESIKANGLKSHVLHCLPDGYPTKQLADVKSYEICNKLKEKGLLMNKVIIAPDRTLCECGKNIRSELLQSHKDKYCDYHWNIKFEKELN